MPFSSNINNYADVKAVLDTIKPLGEGSYRLPTEGKARNWMMRAYMFRRLTQAEARARANVKGYTPPTDYDRMTLKLSGKSVIVNFAPAPEGEIVLPTGEVIKPKALEDTLPMPSATPKVQPLFSKPDQLSSLEEAARFLAEDKGDES